MLEDPAVLKVAQNLKYDALVLSRHGIAVAPYDDTMLISYALDGGKGGSGMNELADAVLGHQPITFDEVAGTGRSQVTFDRVAIDKATEYSAEDADVAHPPVDGAEAPPRRRAHGQRLRDAGAADDPGARAHGGARHQGRSPDSVAPVRRHSRRSSPASRTRSTSSPARRFNIGSPKQLGDILFGKFGLPGGKKTKTGAWATGADVLDELAAGGNELARTSSTGGSCPS